MLDNRAPQDQDIHAAIGPPGQRIARQTWCGGACRSPRLILRKPPRLQFAHDPGGRLVIEAGTRPLGRNRSHLSANTTLGIRTHGLDLLTPKNQQASPESGGGRRTRPEGPASSGRPHPRRQPQGRNAVKQPQACGRPWRAQEGTTPAPALTGKQPTTPRHCRDCMTGKANLTSAIVTLGRDQQGLGAQVCRSIERATWAARFCKIILVAQCQVGQFR